MHLVTPLAGERSARATKVWQPEAGLRIEPGLVDLLVRDCEDANWETLLLLLYVLLPRPGSAAMGAGAVTVEGNRVMGEIRGAVARSADRLYESLPAEQRAKLRSLLLRLVSSSADGERFGHGFRHGPSAATSNESGSWDSSCGRGSSLRRRTASSWSTRRWPGRGRLRSWLDEDAAGQGILRHLSAAAEGWESLGPPATELYRAPDWKRPGSGSRRRPPTSPNLSGYSSMPRSPRPVRRWSAEPMSNEPIPASAVDSAGRWRPSPSWSSSPRAEWSPPTANARRPRRSAVTAAAGALASRSVGLRSGRGDVAAAPRRRGPSDRPERDDRIGAVRNLHRWDNATADPTDRGEHFVRCGRRHSHAEQRQGGDFR